MPGENEKKQKRFIAAPTAAGKTFFPTAVPPTESNPHTEERHV